MNVLWLVGLTTSLDPHTASIINVAYVAQRDGKLGPMQHFVVNPVMHEQDKWLKGSAERFAEAYNAKHGKDPRKFLNVWSAQNTGSFLYSKESVNYNRLEPESLYNEDHVSPDVLVEELTIYITEQFDSKPVMLAGYCVDYIYQLLGFYSRRVGKCDWLERLHENAAVDLLSLALLAKALGRLPNEGLSFDKITQYLNVDYERNCAKSKLLATIGIAEQVFAGALNNVCND